MNFDKNTTALVIVDMQNAFCSKKGSFHKRGRAILGLEDVIKNVKKLLGFARKQKLTVIFTRLVFQKDYCDTGLLGQKNPFIKKLNAYQEESWDSRIARVLTPQASEIIINKKCYDPFHQTDLKNILQKNKIEKIIIAGVLTNVCVESTVRSAFEWGFESIVVKEATSTYSQRLHNGSLTTMRRHFAQVGNFKQLIK